MLRSVEYLLLCVLMGVSERHISFIFFFCLVTFVPLSPTDFILDLPPATSVQDNKAILIMAETDVLETMKLGVKNIAFTPGTKQVLWNLWL